jgi:hypothetical protein
MMVVMTVMMAGLHLLLTISEKLARVKCYSGVASEPLICGGAEGGKIGLPG